MIEIAGLIGRLMYDVAVLLILFGIVGRLVLLDAKLDRILYRLQSRT